MQFEEGAGVYTASGQHVGDIDQVVLDPQTRDITELVTTKGILAKEVKLVPLDRIATATQERVNLKPGVTTGTLTPFEVAHYVVLDEDTQRQFDTTFDRNLFWYEGLVKSGSSKTIGPQVTSISERQVPTESVALVAGSEVFGVDGRSVGQVERMATNTSGSTVYLVVRAKALLHRVRKAIPSRWIANLNDTSISLAISSEMFDQLPHLATQ